MGTQLLGRGLKSSECGMVWNVERSRDVEAIHLAYRNCGCDLITTNSFGGSRFALARHGLADRVGELNRAAAQLARAAAGPDGWVLGDVGPFGDFLEPLGDITADELRAAFRDQIAALLEGGADAVLVETMSDPAEATVGVEAAKACSTKVPVIVTYAFQKIPSGQFRTMMGAEVFAAVQQATAAGAEIVGANCGTSLNLEDYVELARQMVRAAGQDTLDGGFLLRVHTRAGAGICADEHRHEQARLHYRYNHNQEVEEEGQEGSGRNEGCNRSRR